MTLNGCDLYLDSATFHPVLAVLGPLTRKVDDVIYLFWLFFSKAMFDICPDLPKQIFN